jgi:hypothetical protein
MARRVMATLPALEIGHEAAVVRAKSPTALLRLSR